MNKVFKVIWNEARNAYVVVSEIAKNHGSKSCSTKKLLAMLIATGVMTCASFDVLAEQPAADKTAAQQYVALKAKEFDKKPLLGTADRKEYDAQKYGTKKIGGYTYRYDETNKYWVREGYVLTVDKNGGKYTPLSENAIRADVAYKDGVPEGILQSVTSTVSANGTVTNMGESLNKVTAGSFAGVSHSGGTEVEGSWDYIIKDASWEGEVDSSNYKDGYVNLYAGKTATAPKGFVNTDSKDLIWDDSRQAYFYKNQRVDYSNMYVINGKLGVFTNADSTNVYTGTVYGKNNEILMTVKDKDNNFYSYWAAEVTDPSATMATYRVEEYNKNLAKLLENDDALNRNDIKEVTLTNEENSATIGLMRNGDKAVDGAITVTSGGGTDGKDTFVKISNAADTEGKTFATGSKVEAIGSKDATTGIKINGQDYTIKSGSKVSVTQNADKKTTTITVDGTETTITDTDTTYTKGDGIAIDKTNKNAISVKLKEGENNLEVTADGLALKKALTVNSVNAGKFFMDNTNGVGYDGKAYITSSGLNANNQKITGVADGEISATSKDAVNGSQLYEVKNSINTDISKKTFGLKDDKGNEVTKTLGNTVQVKGADGITSTVKDGALEIGLKLQNNSNLVVDDKGLALNTALTGIQSITGVGDGKISFATGGNVNINNITFNNDGRIQGIEAGEDDNDAVNVGQLNKVVAAGDTDVHIQAGNYTVDKNNKVSMNLVDKAGNNEGTVTITGVAKAEDVAVVYDKNKTSLRSTNATVAENAIALGKDASAVKDGGVALGNEAHAGNKGTSLGTKAKSGREGATVVGYNTNSSGLYSTVVGTDAVINTDGTAYQTPFKDVIVQGAAATVVGSKNTVDNKNKKVYSGVANNVMGAANTIEGSNGVTIQGSGNTVTDAYKDMKITLDEGSAILGGDYSVLAKKQSGAVAVVGGANTVSRQTDSTVIGYDNRLIGGEENISHDVFLAGSHNELTNVSDSIVMGNKNTINGVSNVISFGHDNKIKASNAVAIGNGAGVSVEGGVALGVGSVADRAAEVVGYDPATGAEYVIPEDDAASYVWKATKGAVSVGSARETRQITNVAAGTEDTDAVNVAQLKKVSEAAANANKGWKLKTTGGTESVVAPGATVEFDGDDNIQVGNVGNKVSVTLKDALTGITSITGAGEGAGSISFADGSIKLNNKVTIDKNGKISGVAAGEAGTDAVNVSQLNKVSAAAKTEVVKGTNIASVGETTATDGHTVYTVNAKGTSVSVDGNFNLVETTDAATNVTNYGISLKDSVAIGGTHAVTINGTDGTVTGLTNTTWNKDSITSGRAATEDQLHAVATEAGKHTTLSNGKNTTVESTVKDGQTD